MGMSDFAMPVRLGPHRDQLSPNRSVWSEQQPGRYFTPLGASFNG